MTLKEPTVDDPSAASVSSDPPHAAPTLPPLAEGWVEITDSSGEPLDEPEPQLDETSAVESVLEESSNETSPPETQTNHELEAEPGGDGPGIKTSWEKPPENVTKGHSDDSEVPLNDAEDANSVTPLETNEQGGLSISDAADTVPETRLDGPSNAVDLAEDGAKDNQKDQVCLEPQPNSTASHPRTEPQTTTNDGNAPEPSVPEAEPAAKPILDTVEEPSKTPPSEWAEATDPTSGLTYYYNTITGATSWEQPAALATLPPKPTESAPDPTNDTPPETATGTHTANTNKRRTRGHCALVSFSFGGRFVTMKPRPAKRLSITGRAGEPQSWKKGNVVVRRLHQLATPDVGVTTDIKPMGPLNGMDHEDVLKYLREKANITEPTFVDGAPEPPVNVDADADTKDLTDEELLWNLIYIAALNKGRLRSNEGFSEGGAGPEVAIVDLLLRNTEDSTTTSTQALSKDYFSSLPAHDTMAKVQSLLLRGRREEAVLTALTGKQYGLAMIIASACDRHVFQLAARTYASEAMTTGCPLQTFSMLLTGADASNGLWKGTENDSDQQPTYLESTWRQHLSTILSNRIAGWDRLVRSLGDELRTMGCIPAAHACYMVCGVQISSVQKLTGSRRLVLLGCEVPHNSLPSELQTPESLRSYQRSEAWEWAKRCGNPQAAVPALQLFKLTYAQLLVDWGYETVGLEYVRSIRECTGLAKDVGNNSYPTGFAENLDVLEDRVCVSLGVEPPVTKIPKSKKKFIIPNVVSKAFTTIQQRVSATKDELTKSASRVRNDTGDGDGDEGSPAMDNASHSSVSSPAVPGLFGNSIGTFHPTQPVGTRAQPVELKNNIPTPSFISVPQPGGTTDGSKGTIDGTSAVSATTHETPVSNSAKPHDSYPQPTNTTNTTTQPFLSAIPPISSTKNNPTNEVTEQPPVAAKPTPVLKTIQQPPKSEGAVGLAGGISRLTTRKDIKPAPKSMGAPTVTAATPAPKKKKKSPKSTGAPRSGGIFSLVPSFQTYIIGKLNPDAKVADTGEEMKAYFDKDANRWIFPGEDPVEVAKPLAPPPTIMKKKEETAPSTPKDDPTKPVDPLSSLMAPPSRGPRRSVNRSGGGSSGMSGGIPPRYGNSGGPLGSVKKPMGHSKPPLSGNTGKATTPAAVPQFMVFQPSPVTTPAAGSGSDATDGNE